MQALKQKISEILKVFSECVDFQGFQTESFFLIRSYNKNHAREGMVSSSNY